MSNAQNCNIIVRVNDLLAYVTLCVLKVSQRPYMLKKWLVSISLSVWNEQHDVNRRVLLSWICTQLYPINDVPYHEPSYYGLGYSMYHIWKRFGSSEHHTILPCKPRNENFNRLVLYDFSLTVKAAPHECVIRTGQHSTRAPNFFKLFKNFGRSVTNWLKRRERIKLNKA